MLIVLVIGGGVTGCEIAANILALTSRLPRAVRVTVLTRSAQVLTGLSPGAASKVLALLQERGAEIRTNSHVEKIANGSAILTTKEPFAFDILVNATGLLPSPLVRTSGLPVDKDGGLKVDEYLRSIADRDVYGGGDCIAFAGRSLPRAGVFGVRQAPILANNLLASFGHGRPRRFRPQARHLSIMNLGDGTGLARWGSLHWRGRAALRLKDWIDLRFIRSYLHET
jgi:NADH dehydrogenase FAD-containing subunit